MSCRMKENILQVQIYFNKRKDKLFLLKREKKKNIKGIDWQKDDKCIFYNIVESCVKHDKPPL
jgi:hypothetical protein